ncbi:DUF6444 domain-containing protein [Streptomyces mirabilis]
MRSELAQVRAELTAARGEIAELKAESAGLRAENAELKRRLGMNSKNSSKPPSSDNLAKPTPLRKPSRQGPSTYRSPASGLPPSPRRSSRTSSGPLRGVPPVHGGGTVP